MSVTHTCGLVWWAPIVCGGDDKCLLDCRAHIRYRKHLEWATALSPRHDDAMPYCLLCHIRLFIHVSLPLPTLATNIHTSSLKTPRCPCPTPIHHHSCPSSTHSNTLNPTTQGFRVCPQNTTPQAPTTSTKQHATYTPSRSQAMVTSDQIGIPIDLSQQGPEAPIQRERAPVAKKARAKTGGASAGRGEMNDFDFKFGFSFQSPAKTIRYVWGLCGGGG